MNPILPFLFLILMILFFYKMIFRNNAVYKHLKKLIENVSELAEKDLDNGVNYKWRFRMLSNIVDNYNKMVFKFWRPLESFYDRDKLLK